MEMFPHQTAEHRRVFFLNNIASIAYILSIAFAGGLVLVYLATSVWQILPVAAATLLCSVILYASQQQVKKDRIWAAALLITIAMTVAFSLWSLFLGGPIIKILLIVLAWVGPGIIILNGTPNNSRRLYCLIGSVLSTAIILLVSTYEPFPRLSLGLPANFMLVKLLFSLSFTLGTLLIILAIIQGVFSGRLLTRVIVSSLMLVAIPIVTLNTDLLASALTGNQAIGILNGPATVGGIGLNLVANVAIIALALIAAAASAASLARTIGKPLEDVAKNARQLANGELNARATYVEQKDELGELVNAFNDMAGRIHDTVTGMEEQTVERTRSLEKRSSDFETAAQIGHEAASAPNTDEILDQTAQLIHDQFGYYHVGVFIVDENNEFAILRSAAGDAGKLMLANKSKIQVDNTNSIGLVIRTGEPYIVSDTDTDPLYYQNPLLPYTRSEMTLPLKGGGRVIGVLDVQSEKTNQFNQSNFAVMQVITDQVSIAVERVDALQELTRNAEQIEQGYQENITSAWRTFLAQTRKYPGYLYDGVAIGPLTSPSPASLDALKQGKAVISKNKSDKNSCTLAVPIRLRGQTLGTLNLLSQTPEIQQDVVHLVEDAADRLALALENARLIQDAQRLAKREQQINTITAQIQQSTELEIVLQNTVRELGNTLGVPKAFIQIGLTPPETKQKSKK